MTGAIDRESLRAELRNWSGFERRLVLERVVEELSDAVLARLFDGLAHLRERRAEPDSRTRSLRERIHAHTAATRDRGFHAEFILRNAHGRREPPQTAAWLAATAHLFDLALLRARLDADELALSSLRTLTALVAEVDDRIDELVTFEDSCAHDHLAHELDLAARVLADPPPEPSEQP